MRASTTIRKLLAGLLLAVFALGITPKRTLHNLIATHKDGKAYTSRTSCDDTTWSRAAFNCQCDQLVVESPFVPELLTLVFEPIAHVLQQGAGEIRQACSNTIFFSGLRGPPVMA